MAAVAQNLFCIQVPLEDSVARRAWHCSLGDSKKERQTGGAPDTPLSTRGWMGQTGMMANAGCLFLPPGPFGGLGGRKGLVAAFQGTRVGKGGLKELLALTYLLEGRGASQESNRCYLKDCIYLY